MDFDSHTSGMVAAAVGAVNLLTPGHARGRAFEPDSSDEELAALLHTRAPGVSEEDITALTEYAGRLRTVFEAVDEGQIDDACETTNQLLRETHAIPVLTRHDGEPWHLHFHAPDTDWARSWAAPMATAIAVVLGNPMHDRLGVCTAAACDRVFVDTSRNGTKRFCSTTCQNRVKTAAFRARQKN